MNHLTPEGSKLVSDVAARHGVSDDAVKTLLVALAAGQGTQAQFNHPELGGMGQWSGNGMVMVGDMFNSGLKARVDAICTDLSQGIAAGQVFEADPPSATPQGQHSGAGSAAWPPELGAPSSTGSQNGMRYAVFPDTRRLAVTGAGGLEVYDTGEHRISGASQQQGGDQSLSFSSQHGVVQLSDLPKVTTSKT